MAKTKMLCPFSSEICKDCPVYRGRHYYLCFCEKYRGYLKESSGGTKITTPPAFGASSKNEFEIPLIKLGRARDPFAVALKEN